jgi:tricarballylate dehydrogenase
VRQSAAKILEGGTSAAVDSMTTDVLVIGGGNAGLCAAITARSGKARVLVLESSPRALRGGNSRHTRNIRCMHDAPTAMLTDSYSEEEYFADLLRVTKGRTNEELTRKAVRASATLVRWLEGVGVRFQPAMRGTLQLGRTNAFFLGGGKALLNSEYVTAERLGVEVIYDAEVFDLDITEGQFRAARARVGGREITVQAKAVVLAAGGFESNREWLREAWGNAADNFIIRGTSYNQGTVLKLMLNHGAQSVGDPNQCHAIAVDARAPAYDGGIVTRLDSVSLGIVVNNAAQRFYDEGEDFWPKRYAIWGRLIAGQPDQIAYSIIDSKALGRFIPSVFPALRGQSVREVAALLRLPPDALEATVARYNSAARPGIFDQTILDNCHTEGLTPAKSHWALPIDTPPFLAYPLRPGITFTYLGVKVDEEARVGMADGSPSDNIFAAGEIMAGNILGEGYVGGVGMMIGTLFGCIAGKEAAIQCHGQNGARA